jgi:tetratricopeptide (TPR) repeat protein
VLEDLHWGDLPSATFVDAALEVLENRPLMVLALGRPEVRDLFPGLWESRGVQELRLGGLTPRAAEQLIRRALGERATPDAIERIVQTARGSPFYLEELARAVVEGRGESFPETVLAMAAARIDALDDDDRRVLRAASVFGETFWAGGVGALSAGSPVGTGPTRRLARLAEMELLVARPESRIGGDTEFAFRHALFRDAAYESLTPDDRALGHRLAGTWLEERGGADDAVLAEHFERGGLLRRAAERFLDAARQTLRGNDVAGSEAYARRGSDCLARCEHDTGEVGAALQLALAEVQRWRGDWSATERLALATRAAAEVGGPVWCRATALATDAGHRTTGHKRLADLTDTLRGLGAVPATVEASLDCVASLLHHGEEADAVLLFERFEAAADDLARTDGLVAARLAWVRAYRAHIRGDEERYVALTAEAAHSWERIGNRRNALATRLNVAHGLYGLGAYDRAEAILRDVVRDGVALGLAPITASGRYLLGAVLLRTSRRDEAEGLFRSALVQFQAGDDKRLASQVRGELAIIALERGDLETADAEARATLALVNRPGLAYALALRARILRAADRDAESLEAAREAHALVVAGAHDEGEIFTFLELAETLWKTGDRDEARTLVRAARDRVSERASQISDETLRTSFLERVDESAKAIALARDWEADGA